MTGDYTIAPVRTWDQMEALMPEWEGLFSSVGVHNPLAHPGWLVAWSREYVSERDLLILVVRRGGQLVGLAPFYRRRLGLGRAGVTSLQLLGSGQRSRMVELPAVLTVPEDSRRVFRELFSYLDARSADWDWIEVTLAPDQGWFEPQWLGETTQERGLVIHKGSRPCVVMRLPPDRGALLSGLKRNVRESIRRGANRLARQGHTWEMVLPHDAATMDQALTTLIRLHRARSRTPGKASHPDYLRDDREVEFLMRAGRTLGPEHLAPCLLHVDGEPVAGRLLMIANGTAYTLASGFDPAWWDFGVATTLTAESIGWLIDTGCTEMNLSTGVDVAKLRWSEQVRTHEDFLVVGNGHWSRAAFALYWQLRSAALLRRERAVQGRASD